MGSHRDSHHCDSDISGLCTQSQTSLLKCHLQYVYSAMNTEYDTVSVNLKQDPTDTIGIQHHGTLHYDPTIVQLYYVSIPYNS